MMQFAQSYCPLPKQLLLIHPNPSVWHYYRSSLADDQSQTVAWQVVGMESVDQALEFLAIMIPSVLVIHHDRSPIDLGDHHPILNPLLVQNCPNPIIMLLERGDRIQERLALEQGAIDCWFYEADTGLMDLQLWKLKLDHLSKSLNRSQTINQSINSYASLLDSLTSAKHQIPPEEINTLSQQLLDEMQQRSEVEETLKHRTAQFEVVLQSIPDAVLFVNQEREIILVNPAFTLLFGYSFRDILGKSSAILYENYEDFVTLGQLYFHPDRYSYSNLFRVDYLHQLGFILHAETVAAPVRDKDGLLLGYVSIIRDISDRQEAEQALLDSEERFRQLADHIDNVFWLLEVENQRIIYISSAYERIWGQSLGPLLFQHFDHWLDRVHEDDREKFSQLFQVKRGTHWDVEYRIKQSDGKQRWLRDKIFPICNSKGQIYRLAGLTEDITSRKQSLQELQRNRDLREAIFNEATDALFLVDPATDLTLDCNHQAVKLFEAPSKQDLLGIHGKNLQKRSFTDEEVQDILNQMHSQGFWEQEVEYVTFTGKNFWGNLAAKPIHLAGEMMHLVRVTNITDQKQASLQISQALMHEQRLNQLKSQFIAMTSHEFRTPLTIIGSSAGILKTFSDRLSLEDRLEHINIIQHYVTHANNLLSDVLFLSQDSAGRLPFQPNALDVEELLKTIIHHLQLSNSDAQINLDFKNYTSTSIAMVDPQLFQQIFINLISNAIKYSQANKTISVRMWLMPKKQVFEVQDFGIGIPPDTQDVLFESFYRAENVGTIPGTGLGLNIAKRCVELHGGSIDFQSKVNEGTTFRVVLPRNLESPGD